MRGERRRKIFRTLRTMFESAVVDELIAEELRALAESDPHCRG
jgi:hypothetical protein